MSNPEAIQIKQASYQQMKAVFSAFEHRLLRVNSSFVSTLDLEHLKLKFELDGEGLTGLLKDYAAVQSIDKDHWVISPYDTSFLNALSECIKRSGLGLAPYIKGGYINLRKPFVSGRSLKDQLKSLKEETEVCRTKIRAVRRTAHLSLKRLKIAESCSEDDLFNALQLINEQTHLFIQEVSIRMKEKESEFIKPAGRWRY